MARDLQAATGEEGGGMKEGDISGQGLQSHTDWTLATQITNFQSQQSKHSFMLEL